MSKFNSLVCEQKRMEKRELMASAAAAIRNHVAARAWRTWLAFCERRAAKHEGMQAALSHLTGQMTSVAFRAWQVLPLDSIQRTVLLTPQMPPQSYYQNIACAPWYARLTSTGEFPLQGMVQSVMLSRCLKVPALS